MAAAGVWAAVRRPGATAAGRVAVPPKERAEEEERGRVGSGTGDMADMSERSSSNLLTAAREDAVERVGEVPAVRETGAHVGDRDRRADQCKGLGAVRDEGRKGRDEGREGRGGSSAGNGGVASLRPRTPPLIGSASANEHLLSRMDRMEAWAANMEQNLFAALSSLTNEVRLLRADNESMRTGQVEQHVGIVAHLQIIQAKLDAHELHLRQMQAPSTILGGSETENAGADREPIAGEEIIITTSPFHGEARGMNGVQRWRVAAQDEADAREIRLPLHGSKMNGGEGKEGRDPEGRDPEGDGAEDATTDASECSFLSPHWRITTPRQARIVAEKKAGAGDGLGEDGVDRVG